MTGAHSAQYYDLSIHDSTRYRCICMHWRCLLQHVGSLTPPPASSSPPGPVDVDVAGFETQRPASYIVFMKVTLLNHASTQWQAPADVPGDMHRCQCTDGATITWQGSSCSNSTRCSCICFDKKRAAPASSGSNTGHRCCASASSCQGGHRREIASSRGHQQGRLLLANES